jgi:hypothetical protein
MADVNRQPAAVRPLDGGKVGVCAEVLERRIIEELSGWPMCAGVRAVRVGGEKDSWTVTLCDPGPADLEQCRSALTTIIPKLRHKYELL